MTTFATDHDTDQQLRELDERTASAWADYRGSLNELAGEAYEAAELISWERLQQALHELADERVLLAPPPQPAPEHDAAH
jgi:hypothetical protein